MDFSDTQEEAAFREEVRAWIGANAPEYLFEALSTSGLTLDWSSSIQFSDWASVAR